MSKSPLDPDFVDAQQSSTVAAAPLAVQEPAQEPVPEAAPVAPPVEKTGDEIRKENFIRQVMEARNRVEPVYVPPPPTTRQMDQTTRELQRGAERVAFSQDQQKLRPPRPAPDPREGSVLPVFRPSDYQHETKGAAPFKG